MSSAHEDAPDAVAPAPPPAAEPVFAASPVPDGEPAPAWASAGPAGAAPAVTGAPQRSSKLKLGIVAAVSAVIVVGGGVAVAQAAGRTDASTEGRGPGGGPGGGRGGYGMPGGQGFPGGGGQNFQGGQGFPGGGFGRGGMAGGVAGALHGDFVVKDGNGQYVTERLQTGTVTAVSATSITAKSEDGHATTFVIGASTKVDNGAGKVADVKAGDTVTVVGTVSGDTATATEITDIALMRQGGGNRGGGNGNRPGATPQPTRTA